MSVGPWEHCMVGWRPQGNWKLPGGEGVGRFVLSCSLSLWVGGPVIWAIVRGMDVSAPSFLLELRD